MVALLLSGEEAWAKVQECIEQRGFYCGPGSLDARIRRAVDAVGWGELCHNDNVAASRAHFIKIYNAIQCREEKNEVTALVGGEHGFAIAPPSAPRALAYSGEGPDADDDAA